MIHKRLAILSLFLASVFAFQGSNSGDEIEQILTTQAGCWNDGDIEAFMETYWKSEELTFSSGGKTTRGWQGTLDNYKKAYPKDKMGTLTFDGLETTMLSDESALVLGNWHLVLPAKEGTEDVKKDGNFSLVLRKLEGVWKIVHDHSSTLETET